MKVSRTEVVLKYLGYCVKNIENEFYKLNNLGIYSETFFIEHYIYSSDNEGLKTFFKIDDKESKFIIDLTIKILKEKGYEVTLNDSHVKLELK